MSLNTETDVLIVGAGPSGLLAALSLTRLGIKVKIIERRIPGETAGQADGIQSRTVEIWDNLGIGEELKRLATHVHLTATYKPNEEQTGIKLINKNVNIPMDSARYPFELILHSKQIEEIMTNALVDASVHIQQPCILSNLEIIEGDQHPIKVHCTHFNSKNLRNSGVKPLEREGAITNTAVVDRVETIRARYIIGGDGARSWVRQECGIPMEGTMPGLAYGVMDFLPITNFPTARAKNILQSPVSGPIGYIPKPDDTARVYVLLNDQAIIEDLDESSYEVRKTKLAEIINAGFAPYDMRAENISWCSTYKVSQRVASRFSHKGCVFIVGDACHVHSPNGGQGANVSMADSYNLSWKLAHVIRGWASEGILDSYDTERRPYSMELIEFDKEIEKLFRPEGLAPDEFARLWQRQLLFITGLGLRYTSSLIVPERFQNLIPGITIGQRFPSIQILRYMDWAPCNTLDIIGFSLQYKLLIFAGYTTKPDVKQHCENFVQKILENERLTQMVRISLILNVKKEESMAGYIQIQDDVVGRNVFIDDGLITNSEPGQVHDRYNVSIESGAAVLVRPDGHVAMILPVSTNEVQSLANYLSKL